MCGAPLVPPPVMRLTVTQNPNHPLSYMFCSYRYLPERLLPVVSGHHTKAPHRAYTPPMERDEAVYITSSDPHPVSNDNIHSISHKPPQRYYFTDDVYTVSSKVSDRGKYVDQPSSGVATFAPSVSSPDVNQIQPNFRGSFPEPLDTVTDPSVVWPPPDPRASGVGPSQPNVFTLQEEYQNEAKRGLRESHNLDRRGRLNRLANTLSGHFF